MIEKILLNEIDSIKEKIFFVRSKIDYNVIKKGTIQLNSFLRNPTKPIKYYHFINKDRIFLRALYKNLAEAFLKWFDYLKLDETDPLYAERSEEMLKKEHTSFFDPLVALYCRKSYNPKKFW